MKKFILAALIMGTAAFCYAQTATLDLTLTNAKSYIEIQVPKGTKTLIADLGAPVKDLGVYAAQGLSSRLVNGRHLTIVERSADVMQTLDAESGYQLSGEVSDNSIQGIGHKTGAEAVITGNITGSGDQYRINIKITSVRTAELLGQYSVFFQTDSVVNALLASANPPKGRPLWIDEPLRIKEKFEPNVRGISSWYYDVGISNKAASEQLARDRARQNIQQVVAKNIASDMRIRMDITSLSVFDSLGIENVQTRMEEVITNNVRTRVPRFETLEWHIEKGSQEGKEYYLAYVGVRLARPEIITMVEKMDPQAVANNIIRQMNIKATNDERDELIQVLAGVREEALTEIRGGVTGR